ncbi:hypothetical protein [Klebsiella pneumoniae]|nr:hypothetical protein [Klebsiella pneumoniae]
MKYFMAGFLSLALIGIGGYGFFRGEHNWGWWLFAAAIVWGGVL